LPTSLGRGKTEKKKNKTAGREREDQAPSEKGKVVEKCEGKDECKKCGFKMQKLHLRPQLHSGGGPVSHGVGGEKCCQKPSGKTFEASKLFKKRKRGNFSSVRGF